MRSTTFQTALLILGAVYSAGAVEKEGDNPLDWLRDAIPGEPGTDYPIYATVAETSFSCDGLIFGGYYADPEMECQAYHVCLQDPISTEVLFPVSFLCPNGTIFNQQIFTCDWWFNVDCSASVGLYGGAVGAFGGNGAGANGEGGQCPAAAPLPADQCAGAVSNCWSPGQTDTDCPSNGLCCFDGCADTCVDGPAPAPKPTAPRPTPAAPRPTPAAPRPTPAPKPEPVIAEEESEQLPQSVPTPTPAPVPTPAPAPIKTTAGYNYEIPDIQLEITKPSRPAPGLPTLYGAPPPGRKRRSLLSEAGRRF